jgi:hypothetical protein
MPGLSIRYSLVFHERFSGMKIDQRFAARLAAHAAQIVCDGDDGGTWDNPESVLKPGCSVESAMKLAGYRVYGGPGWWRRNFNTAYACLRMIRWSVSDEPDDVVLGLSAEAKALWNELSNVKTLLSKDEECRNRWNDLDIEGQLYMLLLASEFLKEPRLRTDG